MAAVAAATVFVWSNLDDGEAHCTPSRVALNDDVMVFAFTLRVGVLVEVPERLSALLTLTASTQWNKGRRGNITPILCCFCCKRPTCFQPSARCS